MHSGKTKNNKKTKHTQHHILYLCFTVCILLRNVFTNRTEFGNETLNPTHGPTVPTRNGAQDEKEEQEEEAIKRKKKEGEGEVEKYIEARGVGEKDDDDDDDDDYTEEEEEEKEEEEEEEEEIAKHEEEKHDKKTKSKRTREWLE